MRHAVAMWPSAVLCRRWRIAGPSGSLYGREQDGAGAVIKKYHKEGRALRNETTTNNPQVDD